MIPLPLVKSLLFTTHIFPSGAQARVWAFELRNNIKINPVTNISCSKGQKR